MNRSEHQSTLPPFRPGQCSSGVLLHMASRPSPYGIGDVGPAAFAWVDQLHDAGQRWWQALPLGPSGLGNSPYSCLSSFAGNSLLISPDLLNEDGLLRPSDGDAGRCLPKGTMDFDAVHWRWCCTEDMLKPSILQRLRDLTTPTGRMSSVKTEIHTH